MKIIIAYLTILTSIFCLSLTANAQRIHTLFDEEWKFNKGDISNGQDESLNDKAWRTFDLPHDWSIEDLPTQLEDSIVGPFSRSSIGTTATGYVLGGTAWYRKHFSFNNTANKKVTITFDGIYMNSDVWINGHLLGNHPYGYTPFHYDLTPFLKPTGQQNILAVRVRNEGKNSRWYSGSGIYRHVWLTITNPLHIEQGSAYVTTPIVSTNTATVNVITTVANDENKGLAQLRTIIKDATGKVVASTLGNITLYGNSTKASVATTQISRPHLWSPEDPYLYRAETKVQHNGKTIDNVCTTFGIRSIEFSALKGFLLNGKRTLLKGGCMHHDNGPLGSATLDRAEERKVQLLKSYGYNAVRTSHNPPSPKFLDACDRLGVLVIDEAFDQWQRPKNSEDYNLYFNDWWEKDLSSMILRDRNHPSIILWSIGNEINERADSSGLVIRKKLVDVVHDLDDTRPVTEAICHFWDHRGYQWDTTAAAFKQLDAGGYNYMWRSYEKDHQKFPERIMVGTESIPKEAFENWQQVEQHPWVLGDFVWTAMDYLGETGIGHSELDSLKNFVMPWPWFNAYCGDIDLIGGKKPQSWYRDIVWRRSKISMLVHAPAKAGHKEVISQWGWPDEYPSWNFAGNEGQPLNVNVYTRYSSVRIMLNDKMINEKTVSTQNLTASFSVNYQPGRLVALAMQGEEIKDSFVLKTTGKAYKLRLEADRNKITSNRNDLSYVTVEVVDDNNDVIPDAEIPVHFSIEGNGEISATGNANPSDMASFHKPERKTFRGRCLAIVRPKGNAGTILLKATAEGLLKDEIKITTQ